MAFNNQNHRNLHHLDDPIQPIPTKIIPTARRYRECMKNHTIISTTGEQYHTVDGCCEFTPAGPDGSPESMRCAACGCHRCYHRSDDLYLFYPLRSAPYVSFMPPPRTPCPAPITTGYVNSTQTEMQLQLRPLALPSPQSQGDDKANNLNGGAMPEAGSAGCAIKRVRTKFTTEQKRMMYDIAERIGWRLNRCTDGLVQKFCNENGLRRHVFKVWLHNHKKKAISNNGIDNNNK